jgi:valyl-tRNA synthetase
MLDKTYDAGSVEPHVRDLWEKAGAFRAGAGAEPGAEPFSIVIPPPNVTGSLHMGHALNNTLQDVLVRFARMRGKDVLWQPGMDHAGIATQMVVERQMMERQEPNRRAIGRDAFVEKVWEWKAQSGGIIINQLKRLGASCDWSRERFTMDEGLSRAVIKVFVRLHKEGLIYRDKRLVNWDPKLVTAISDLEVQPVEVSGYLWHFRYPIEGEGRFIIVATTRPETMLGDTAVAVHPEDERYRDLIGKYVILPLVGRRIPIVADDYADPQAGSGAVKITPAHDFNDFEVARRRGLPAVNVMDTEATIRLRGNEDFLRGVPPSAELAQTIEELDGLDRMTARASVVSMMEERELIEKTVEHVHSVPHGDRSGVPIEPFLTDQWYVNAKALATPAIASVKAGRTTIAPKQPWEKTYFDWMENIEPWCISRQLWWGHRIPAWYGPDGEIFVEETEAEAEAAAFRRYGVRQKLNRDEDVLDTWFSSALWPFSTLGWPEETPELRRYYPTSVLVTGFDIIFFWVARMMMMGLHFMGNEPFHKVYIHGIVRDEAGAKMSKSKGNVVDPLDLIDEFGADALRFTMASLATPGRDVKPSRARIEGYRNFGTKVWNAARFCEMNGCRAPADFDPSSVRETVNRWILSEATQTADSVTAAIEAFRFNDAAEAIYHFAWGNFCDWYLELIKPVLAEGGEAAKAETRASAGTTLQLMLHLLHPFMPYITEALWQEIGDKDATVLALSRWPSPGFSDVAAAEEVNWVVELVSAIRSVRSEMNVPPAAKPALVLVGRAEYVEERFGRHQAAIERLARIEGLQGAASPPVGSAQLVVGAATFALPLAGIIDFAAEEARLSRELKRVEAEIARIDKKLANENFIGRAPGEVVDAEREKRASYAADGERLSAALKRVKQAA